MLFDFLLHSIDELLVLNALVFVALVDLFNGFLYDGDVLEQCLDALAEELVTDLELVELLVAAGNVVVDD